MAPHDPKNTARFFLDYRTPLAEHTLVMRVNGAVSDAEAIATAEGYTNAVKGLLFGSTQWTQLRKAAAGTNVSFGVPWSPVQPTSGLAQTQHFEPYFISMTGRDPNGIRAKLTQFGCTVGLDASYRVFPSENADIVPLLNYVQLTSNSFVTIAGAQPLWNTYVNVGYNAYWQRQQRT